MLLFLAVRVLVLVVAYTAPLDKSRPGLFWVDMPLARWDYGHYYTIMDQGYPRDNPRAEQIAFFPGYPVAGKLLRPWLPPDLALPVVSNIASTLAVVFIYLWVRKLYEARVAFWTVVLLSAYPPSMFLSAGYADALLLLCVAVASWCMSRGHAYGAALASAYATFTRPTGLALAAVIVLWAWLANTREGWGKRTLRIVPLGALSVAGLIAFQAYLWHHYGRPDAFVQTQSNWGFDKPVPNKLERILTLKPLLQPAIKPLKYLARGEFAEFRDPLQTWSPIFSLIAVAVSIYGLIRPGPAPRVLFLLPILVFLMAYLPDPYRGARMVGIARYHLIALPVFATLAAGISRRCPAVLRYGLVIGLLALECMYTRQFADWRYIG